MRRRLLLAALLLTVSSPVRADETVVPRFDIKSILLEGNTVLPTPVVASILKKYTGPQKDFGTLQEAMDELETAYRKRGYTMVTVILPEQELQRGTVIINALEPTVKEIIVEGNKHFSRDNILAALPTLKTNVPPKVTEISENLRAANENPAKKMTLQFKAKDKPEDLAAVIQVKDQKPWKVALNGDNTGSKQSGYYRMGLTLQHSNLWDMDHVAALSYSTSPDHADKVKIISGSYRLPIYKLGDTIDLFGGYSDVDNGITQISGTDLSVSGKGIVSGVRYNLTLPRFGEYEQKLQMGMDYRLYDNTVTLLGTDLAKDVVAHPFSVTYGGAWNTETITADGYVGVLHNQPWGGQGQQSDFAAVRGGAVADYWIFRYGFNKMVRLPEDWLVRAFGTGQYTPDRLIPGEQFGLGGSSSVRGYEEREESWDAGFSGGLELYSPDIAKLAEIPHTQFRLAGFFDGGTGYNLRRQAGENGSNALTSLGTGFRLGISDYFSFSLDWGYALKRSTNTLRGGSAVHFKGSITY